MRSLCIAIAGLAIACGSQTNSQPKPQIMAPASSSVSAAAQAAFMECQELHRSVEPEFFEDDAKPAHSTKPKETKPKRQPTPEDRRAALTKLSECYAGVLRILPTHPGGNNALARLHIKLGKCASAYEIYSTFLKDPYIDESERAEAYKSQELLLKGCPWVMIQFPAEYGRGENIKVDMDGEPIHPTRYHHAPVNIGRHVITADPDGKQPVPKEIDVVRIPDCKHPASIEGEKLCSKEYIVTFDAFRPDPLSNQRRTALAFGAASLAMVGGELISLIISAAKWSEAVNACNPPFSSRDTICRDSDGVTAATPPGDVARDASLAALILGVAAGAAAVTGTALWLTDSPVRSEAAQPSVTLIPLITLSPAGHPVQGGAALTGRF